MRKAQSRELLKFVGILSLAASGALPSVAGFIAKPAPSQLPIGYLTCNSSNRLHCIHGARMTIQTLTFDSSEKK